MRKQSRGKGGKKQGSQTANRRIVVCVPAVSTNDLDSGADERSGSDQNGQPVSGNFLNFCFFVFSALEGWKQVKQPSASASTGQSQPPSVLRATSSQPVPSGDPLNSRTDRLVASC